LLANSGALLYNNEVNNNVGVAVRGMYSTIYSGVPMEMRSCSAHLVARPTADAE